MSAPAPGGALWTNRNGLRSKLLDFFADNPDATLTRAQIARQFDKTIKSVDRVVAELRTAGVLESACIYRLKPSVVVTKRSMPTATAAKPDREVRASTAKPLSWDFEAPFPLQDAWNQGAARSRAA